MSRLLQNRSTGQIYWSPPREKHTRQSTSRRYARENGDKAVARKVRQLLRRVDFMRPLLSRRCEKMLTRKEVEFLRAHATEVEL